MATAASPLAPPSSGATPPGVGGIKDVIDKLQSREGGQEEALRRYQEKSAAIDKADMARQDKIQTASAANKPPKYDPAPPPVQKLTEPQEMWGSLAMTMAVLSSFGVRSHLTAALNAAAGTMNSYHQRDMEKFDRDFKAFEVANNNALKQFEYENNNYKAVMADFEKRAGLSEKQREAEQRDALNELRAHGIAYKDDNMVLATEGRLFHDIDNAYDQVAKLVETRNWHKTEAEALIPKLVKGQQDAARAELMKNSDEYKKAMAENNGPALMKVLRTYGFSPGADHQEKIANGLMTQVEKNPVYKAYSNDRRAKEILEQDKDKIARGELLDSQEQTALVDVGTRMLTSQAMREFMVKMTQKHGSLADAAAVWFQKGGKGGALSPDQIKTYVRILDELRQHDAADMGRVVWQAKKQAEDYGVDNPDYAIPFELRDEEFPEPKAPPAPSARSPAPSSPGKPAPQAAGGKRIINQDPPAGAKVAVGKDGHKIYYDGSLRSWVDAATGQPVQ